LTFHPELTGDTRLHEHFLTLTNETRGLATAGRAL
jgi:glutamine amidotransferase PdxT